MFPAPFGVYIKNDGRNFVEPKEKMVTVYDLEHDRKPTQHPFSERLKAGIYEDLYIDLGDFQIL